MDTTFILQHKKSIIKIMSQNVQRLQALIVRHQTKMYIWA